ncbi:hypothetical protein EN875_032050 [Mesorhizobium sp. M2D.F.Ca.ET.232.01.1.1]|uniref:LamG-like jellyroll fold domain-containing protein n=1 Tax=Mesorhizobium sp. M2D.F.Ca.ET.232.01.1.1 TaxID=2496670 RepID=UPI000FCB2DF2|nr:LamG-like jellyroll fold domain-containing protein [Mesorhizobium sp. M2D.F.Ca.ET.232.01.1.1]TGP28193.1 hypothetical protein EN875_032050 [Mesorhizobium sp. M2D.F.Ca.ET.232.01.1.1]
MIDLPPPPKFLIDPPRIIRPDEGLMEATDRRMKLLGLDRAVRRVMLSETRNVVADLEAGKKPVLRDVIVRRIGNPLLASMLVNPFVYGGGVATDPSIANVVLLLGFEGANNSTTLTDESPAAHGSGTVNGDAHIDTAQFKFGSSSGKFDTSGDYWSWADSNDWRLSTANSDTFTIEFWIRPNGTASNASVMGQAAGFGSWAWYIDRTETGTPTYAMTFNWSVNGTVLQTLNLGVVGLTSGAWHYIAISKNSSGKIRSWYNGNFGNSVTPADSSMFNSTAAFELGRALATTGLNAWLDEVRITKGVCRYDTDGSISVPTAAFPRS